MFIFIYQIYMLYSAISSIKIKIMKLLNVMLCLLHIVGECKKHPLEQHMGR